MRIIISILISLFIFPIVIIGGLYLFGWIGFDLLNFEPDDPNSIWLVPVFFVIMGGSIILAIFLCIVVFELIGGFE